MGGICSLILKNFTHISYLWVLHSLKNLKRREVWTRWCRKSLKGTERGCGLRKMRFGIMFLFWFTIIYVRKRWFFFFNIKDIHWPQPNYTNFCISRSCLSERCFRHIFLLIKIITYSYFTLVLHVESVRRFL